MPPLQQELYQELLADKEGFSRTCTAIKNHVPFLAEKVRIINRVYHAAGNREQNVFFFRGIGGDAIEDISFRAHRRLSPPLPQAVFQSGNRLFRSNVPAVQAPSACPWGFPLCPSPYVPIRLLPPAAGRLSFFWPLSCTWWVFDFPFPAFPSSFL